MDRSTSSSAILGMKSPFSPRPRQSLSNRRSSVLPGFSKKPSSRFSVSGRSNQSLQVVAKTQFNTGEAFGLPLPVLVTEALTFAENIQGVSVQISPIGWAWVVCGRRLLIWQWKETKSSDTPGRANRGRTIGQQCRELTLPQSDLSHRAELVAVFITDGNQVPSCIAVSPEGLVRYWPSIAHEGTSIEESADLQGQECDSLTNIFPLGCILATTTCSLVLVQPISTTGRHCIQCKTLKPPSGWLGGLGRRMSSFIFGGIPSGQGVETKLIKVIAVKQNKEEFTLWVLAGHGLQKWTIGNSDHSEKLIYECEVFRMIRDAFHERIWDNCSGDPNELDNWILDMQPSHNGITLLAAAVNMQGNTQLRYAFAHFSGDSPTAPTQFQLFCPIKHTSLYSEDTESETLSLRFILTGSQAYIYNNKIITIVSASQPNEDYDTMEFATGGDRLLGGAIVNNSAVFFTKNHGLVTVIPNDFQPGDLANSSIQSEPGSPFDSSILSPSPVVTTDPSGQNNLTLYDMDPKEMLESTQDTMSQVKAAFISYIKKDFQSSEDLLHTLFDNHHAGVDTIIDKTVLDIVNDLLEDLPANDPRWTDVSRRSAGLGSSYSMQILHQLENKQRALQLFINFLKGTNLWNKLSLVTHRGNIMATVYVMAEYAEKVVAAISMRKLQSSHSQLFDKSIRFALEGEELTPHGLTPQDLFYVQVTKVHSLIQAITKSVDDIVHSDASQSYVISLINESNIIILSILQDVIKYRQQNAELFTPENVRSEYLPWTTAMGKHGLRDCLILQHSHTLKHGARCCDDSLRLPLYDHLVNLTDIILDGRQSHLESTKGTEKYQLLLQQYESQRTDLIYPLVEDEQYERAASLAEKYLDFQILILICNSTENQSRLDEYMERFAEHDFSNFLFGWYIKKQKGGALLNRFKTRQAALSSFLGDHPTLSWIQQSLNGQSEKACETLSKLADEEEELLSRKKTKLSLAKLAALCSSDDMSNTINQINDQLIITQLQEDLPDVILDTYVMDKDKMKVLTVPEIIQLYIDEENSTASEMEFRKALELLNHISDPLERTNLFNQIWLAVVRRDSWTYSSNDNPVDVVMNTLFFRLVEFCFLMGEDIDDIVPPIEQILNAPELGSFGYDKSFQYLLKVGYDHIHRTHKAE